MHLLLCLFSIDIVTENKEIVLNKTHEACFPDIKNLQLDITFIIFIVSRNICEEIISYQISRARIFIFLFIVVKPQAKDNVREPVILLFYISKKMQLKKIISSSNLQCITSFCLCEVSDSGTGPFSQVRTLALLLFLIVGNQKIRRWDIFS